MQGKYRRVCIEVRFRRNSRAYTWNLVTNNRHNMVLANAEECVHVEPRASIYGRADSEWSSLADWFVDYGFADPARGYEDKVAWLIQVSRKMEKYCI